MIFNEAKQTRKKIILFMLMEDKGLRAEVLKFLLDIEGAKKS